MDDVLIPAMPEKEALMLKTKRKDMIILSYLRHNARIQLTDLSRQSGIPVSTLFDKLKTTTPFIRKYTTLVNFQQLGFATRAMVVLKVKKNNREEVSQFIHHHKSINTAFKINNGCDYILDVLFNDMKELEDFLEHIQEQFKVEKQQVYYILDILKQEDFLSSPEFAHALFS